MQCLFENRNTTGPIDIHFIRVGFFIWRTVPLCLISSVCVLYSLLLLIQSLSGSSNQTMGLFIWCTVPLCLILSICVPSRFALYCLYVYCPALPYIVCMCTVQLALADSKSDRFFKLMNRSFQFPESFHKNFPIVNVNNFQGHHFQDLQDTNQNFIDVTKMFMPLFKFLILFFLTQYLNINIAAFSKHNMRFFAYIQNYFCIQMDT